MCKEFSIFQSSNFKCQIIIRSSNIRLKVLCIVCNIASRDKCWDGKVFEDGGEEGRSERRSFNKSMNIVKQLDARSRIISTLSENNYTLSGRIRLPSCLRLSLPSPQGVSNRSIIFPPHSSGHCLLNRTLRRYSPEKSLRGRSSFLLVVDPSVFFSSFFYRLTLNCVIVVCGFCLYPVRLSCRKVSNNFVKSSGLS